MSIIQGIFHPVRKKIHKITYRKPFKVGREVSGPPGFIPQVRSDQIELKKESKIRHAIRKSRLAHR